MINREELNVLAEAGRNNTINIEDIDFEDVKKFYESMNIGNFDTFLIDLGPNISINAFITQTAHRYLEEKLGLAGLYTELSNQIADIIINLCPDFYKKVEYEYTKWILNRLT